MTENQTDLQVTVIHTEGTVADKAVDVVRRALITVERDFSMRVGQGNVQPGTFLTDRDRAGAVVSALEDAGYLTEALSASSSDDEPQSSGSTSD